MLKNSVFISLLTAALLSPANAVVSGPQGSSSMIGVFEGATQIAWVCGPLRCVWKPGWRLGLAPRFVVWGPPRLPGCFYEKRGRVWIEICP
jgi:hypothetical protein